MDLISVIIPAYNVEKYIDRCIESIVNQTYKYLEIIIVNDGSTDGTAQKCDQWKNEDPRIKVVHQKNKGVVMARNAALEIAIGEYVLFVDADDYIDVTMCEKMIQSIGNSELLSVGYIREFENGESTIRFDVYAQRDALKEYRVDEILSTMIYDFNCDCVQPLLPCLCNKLYRRDIAECIFKQVPPSITHGEDTCFVYQYVLHSNSLAFLGEALYHYTVHEDSACSSVNETMLSNINSVYLYLKDIFSLNPNALDMIYQLQAWIRYWVCDAMNDSMGFEKENRIPRFLIDVDMFANKKVAIYAAGRVGRDMMYLMKKKKICVSKWVDRNCEYHRRHGFNVEAVNSLLEKNYDVIVIAVSDECVAESIKVDLLALGLDEGIIYWQKPLCIY